MRECKGCEEITENLDHRGYCPAAICQFRSSGYSDAQKEIESVTGPMCFTVSPKHWDFDKPLGSLVRMILGWSTPLPRAVVRKELTLRERVTGVMSEQA